MSQTGFTQNSKLKTQRLRSRILKFGDIKGASPWLVLIVISYACLRGLSRNPKSAGQAAATAESGYLTGAMFSRRLTRRDGVPTGPQTMK